MGQSIIKGRKPFFCYRLFHTLTHSPHRTILPTIRHFL
nr:MAG TPA: hypothetical protein [Caudoviricetes sp.]